MSVFSDGCLELTTTGLQERLERGISSESRATIEKILVSVSRLSNVEKLFLYLRLPTHVPAVNTATECVKTSSDTESLTVTWMKTHLTRNSNTSLLRQKVYDDYRMFCEAQSQESVSVSDFKKILSSVFPQLTTRRLGSRGNAKHMFGGISYRMQPNSFTVPKIKVEDDNEEAFCDDTATHGEGGREDGANEAASRLILEWAYKLLSIPFESIQHLAVHLISKSYVSQVSEEAFTLTAGTNCEAHNKDSSEEISATDPTQKPLSTRHQLQRKLQERRDITRQKQRMEEERSHLSTQESVPGLPAAKHTQKNPLPGVSRTPGPRLDAERNTRRPAIPAILPKTLLPKLVVGSRLAPDPRAQRAVDPPQFILLSPGASQLQSGHTTGSLVFISSSLPQTVQTPDARLPIQAMVQNVQAGLRPGWVDLPRGTTSDLASSVPPAPLVIAESRCTRPSEAGGISQVFSGNAQSVDVVCGVVNGYAQTVCHNVVSDGRQGSHFGGGRQGNHFVGNVQEARSLALSTKSSLAMPHMSVSAGVYTGKAPLSTSLNCSSQLVHKSPPDNANTSDYRISSRAEPLTAPPGQQIPCGASVKSATRTANPPNQGSKGRCRNVPSRSSTKTVSSILDEQRCSGIGGGRAMRFYNDSRNVSQILKELREKSGSLESEGIGGLDADRAAATNSFVGIVPPNFQIVQVLPQCSGFRSTDEIVQSPRASTCLGPPSTSKIQGLLSSGSVVHLIRPTELTLPSPTVPKTESELHQTSSVFNLVGPAVSRSESSVSKLTISPERGGKMSTCGGFLQVTVSTSGVEVGDSVGSSFVGSGISHADSTRPDLKAETFSYLGVPVIMSTSESQSSTQTGHVGFQQLFLKPVEKALTAITFSESSAPPVKVSYGISSSEAKAAKRGQVNVSRSADNNRGRSAVKRNVAGQNYCGIKRLLLGDDRPERQVERPPVGPEYFPGGVDMGVAVANLPPDCLHSPGGEPTPVPYRDDYAQHCTLQQLSQVSVLRTLQQARLRQQADSQVSRPASAFGDDKTGLGPQGSRPGRPNTVTGGDLDGVNPEAYYLGYGPPSADGSPGSERSTPMSGGMSPRSNLSACSLYLDQTNAFMPIQITDSLPSVAAIKPLPTLGQRHLLETEGPIVSRPTGLAASYTADARSFVPYTSSSESPRVARSGGFAPASSIRPLKRGGQEGVPSRQRHHSAHDFQNSCNKWIGLQETYEDLPPAPAFSGSASSTLGLLPGAMLPPVFDFQDLEAAGEVEEIISANHEETSSSSVLQRSHSEPANRLQAGCTFSLEEMINEMLNDDAATESSTAPGSAENLSSRGGSQVDWSECSGDRCRDPLEKLDDARWSGSSRDRLISGVELRPPLAFSGDLNSSGFGAYERAAGGGAFVDGGCTPPLSQNSSPEFASEMPLFDKPDKRMEAFAPDGGGQSTALDTPSSLEGLFGTICEDDGEGNGQSTGCNMDFNWPY